MIEKNDTRERYSADGLRNFTRSVLVHFGMLDRDAIICAQVLIDADLQGIESHGIAHLPWHKGYVPGFINGSVNPKLEISVLRESAATASWDANGAFGLLTGYRAMEATIAKAQSVGIGMITVCNSRHFGAAGYYAQMASKQGLIGMAMCNVRPLAVAAGGQEPVFGTNPIAMSAPINGEHSFLLDIATTAVAGGKLEIANRQHKRIPFGWALDAEGFDTDDPLALKNNGSLLPLGSHTATSVHKGYGLGLMVDILCGPLSGLGSGLFSNQLVGETGQWFAAWRIDSFRDPDEFAMDMQRMVDYIRDSKPNKGVASVLVPGDPEANARSDREANGIPLDEETVEGLQELSRKINISAPIRIS